MCNEKKRIDKKLRILVINNLDAGLGDKSVFSFLRDVSSFADEIVIRSCNKSYDSRAYLYDAQTFDAIVCAGGDGTIASISHMLAYTKIPLLPYPAGTANLLALNLYQPSDNPALALQLKKFNTLDFDLGEIVFQDGIKRGFSIMAGAGYDAEIMKGALPSKKILGSLSYATAAVSNFAPQCSKLSIEVDGEKHETSGVGVLVINFSKIQFDISVVHENKPRDGYFDIVVFNTNDAIGLIPAIMAAILDRGGDYPTRSNAFQIYRGKHVRVEADPPLPVQYDGEIDNRTTPFEAHVLEKASTLIVSDEAIANYEDK